MPAKIDPENKDSQLYVIDMVQYLSDLAKLHRKGKTGNLKLSDALQSLADALRPYSGCSISELSDAFKSERIYNPRTAWSENKPELQLPSELENASQEDVEKILADDNYTKQQVIELGVRRFGISKSKLSRLRKKDVQESVRASLEHEKTLAVISEEARKGGRARLV